jgi:hypothetical protein
MTMRDRIALSKEFLGRGALIHVGNGFRRAVFALSGISQRWVRAWCDPGIV